MPLTCSICKHKQRSAIERDLLAQVPLRNIASRFGTSTGSLQRHRPHIAKALVKVQMSRAMRQAESVYDELQKGHRRVEDLFDAAQRILNDALESGDKRGALGAVKVARDTLGEIRAHLQFRAELERERPIDPELSVDELRERLRAKLSRLLLETNGVIDMTPVVTEISS